MQTRVNTIPSISTMVSTAKYLGIGILHSESDCPDFALRNDQAHLPGPLRCAVVTASLPVAPVRCSSWFGGYSRCYR